MSTLKELQRNFKKDPSNPYVRTALIVELERLKKIPKVSDWWGKVKFFATELCRCETKYILNKIYVGTGSVSISKNYLYIANRLNALKERISSLPSNCCFCHGFLPHKVLEELYFQNLAKARNSDWVSTWKGYLTYGKYLKTIENNLYEILENPVVLNVRGSRCLDYQEKHGLI